MARYLAILLFLLPLVAFAFPAKETYIAPPVEPPRLPKVLTIEEKVVAELGEDFLPIAKCESEYRQFKADGSLLVSSTTDIGIMQINQIHFEEAEKLGIDIRTVDGNIAFAKILKKRNGKRDWYMSQHCWDK